MATTARDIIQDVFEFIDVYAPGDTMSDADAERALVVLNDLINLWADDNLFIYQAIATTITLAVGKKAYTIGATGTPDIVQQRPRRIDMGPGAANVTISAVTTPINVVSAIEWNMIESLATASGTPDTLFFDPQYPNGVLNVAPTPSAIGTLIFGAWQPLASFTSLAQPSVTFAQGGLLALKSNLAFLLRPYFKPGPPPATLIAAASASKGALQRSNLVSRAMLGREPRAMRPAPAAAPAPAPESAG